MTLVKNKQTGAYKVKFKTPSGTKTLSTKTTNKKEAQNIAKQANVERLEAAAKAGKLTAEMIGMITAGRRVTCEHALTEFLAWRDTVGHSKKTILNSEMSVTQMMDHCKIRNVPPAIITEKHVNDFVNRPGDFRYSTRYAHLVHITAFLDFCSAKGWVMGNPGRLCRVRMENLTHAQKEPKQRHPFTDAEVQQILDYTAKEIAELSDKASRGKQRADLSSIQDKLRAARFWHTATAIGRYLGLRLGDICKIEWDCFGQPGKVVVWTEKRDRRVSLPLEPKVLADAIAAVPPNNTRFLFPEEAAIYDDLARRPRFSVYFQRILQRLGIEGKSFHDLRSSFIADCLQRGIPIEHISYSVGHMQITTTQRYVPQSKMD